MRAARAVPVSVLRLELQRAQKALAATGAFHDVRITTGAAQVLPTDPEAPVLLPRTVIFPQGTGLSYSATPTHRLLVDPGAAPIDATFLMREKRNGSISMGGELTGAAL